MVGLAKLVLSKLCGGNFANFDLFLPSVQLHVNTKISLLTKTTPMTYVFSLAQNAFADYSRAESRLLTEPELAERATVVREIVFPSLSAAVSTRQEKKRGELDDSRRVVAEQIANGARVMVRDVTRSQSGAPYFTGPFVVLRCTAAQTYTLLTPDGALFHRNVPRKDLKVISGAPLIDLADLDSLDRTYLIERVVDHRVVAGVTQFLVKWKGYADQTWEPSANFVGVGDAALRAYWSERNHSPRIPVDVPLAPAVQDVNLLPAVASVEVAAVLPAVISSAVIASVPAAVPATRLGRIIRAPKFGDE